MPPIDTEPDSDWDADWDGDADWDRDAEPEVAPTPIERRASVPPPKPVPAPVAVPGSGPERSRARASVSDEQEASRSEPEWFPRFLPGSLAEGALSHAAVREAYEAGNGPVLKRALENARRSTAGRGREAVEAALAETRVLGTTHFATPSLGRLNGCGTGMYGAADHDPSDGSYVKTYCISFFWIPVIPIAQYLVQDAGRKGWYFLRKLPAGRALRIWQGCTVGAAALLLLGIAVAALYGSSHADVHVLNGLDFAVDVTIGEERVSVPSQGRETIEFSDGSYPVVTLGPGGKAVEELTLTVPGGHDLVVYNVLGAAPLYVEGIVYKANAGPNLGEDNEITWAYGRSRYVRDNVDYVFEEPPTEISLGRSRNQAIRYQADILEGGWKTTVEQLYGDEKAAEAAELAAAVAVLSPEDPETLDFAIDAIFVHPETARRLELMERVADAAPASSRMENALTQALIDGGRKVEAMSRARKRYETQRDLDAGFLYASLQAEPEAITFAEQMVSDHPNEISTVRALLHRLTRAGRWESALPHFAKFETLDPPAARTWVVEHARALVGVGRNDDAVELADRVRGELGPDDDGHWVALYIYGLLRALPGAPSAGPTVDELGAGMYGQQDWDRDMRLDMAAHLGVWKTYSDHHKEETDYQNRLRCWTMLTARTAPEKTVEAAEDLAEETLADTPDWVLLTLAAELHSAGQREHVERVLAALDADTAAILNAETFADYLQTGRMPDGLWPQDRAALLMARSRAASDEREKKRLEDEARAADPLLTIFPR